MTDQSSPVLKARRKWAEGLTALRLLQEVVAGEVVRLDKILSGEHKTCAFCLRGSDEPAIKVMVKGPGVSICDDCVAVCQTLVADELLAREAETIDE